MDLLKKLSDIKFKTVDVKADELGEGAMLRVRELSGCEQMEFYEMLQKKDNNVKAMSYALLCSLVDDNGDRQLKSLADAETVVKGLPAKLFQRINKALFTLNSGDAEKN